MVLWLGQTALKVSDTEVDAIARLRSDTIG